MTLIIYNLFWYNVKPGSMEEIKQNTGADQVVHRSQDNIADLKAEKENLAAELEKARRKQKIFNIIVVVMVLIFISGIFLAFWVYKKVKEYNPFLESMIQMSRETSDFIQLNKIQSEIYSSHQSTASISSQSSSQSEFAGSSLSMIGTSQDLAAAAATAADDPESGQEMAEVVDEYKETPEMKKMLEEFKKDPELGKIFENYQSDPSQIIKKMNDPAVIKKIMDKMVKNPGFMSTMLKMASDPRVMKSISKQNAGVNKNPVNPD